MPVLHPARGTHSTTPHTTPAAISPRPAATEKAMRSGVETLSSAAFIARSRTGST